ncbi:integrase family protein [Cereibacter sphaeroides]|uniref:integrase family protein n=1 Tax=Cereibacter sphaeroides TaxID=1063 RepID=UPI001F48B6C8|nr:integrase family protein [Cereibacter sphaeroides]MCE6957964.1 integrase family protein [Cereibacter sphaeroides]MCE6971771.1 integrase family protein [Cereibacter sphaeroides]
MKQASETQKKSRVDTLTDTKIRGLAYDGTPTIIRDRTVKGFMVAVNKTSKTYKIQADLWQGVPGRQTLVRTIRHTLGDASSMPVAEARQTALQYLLQIKSGVDPFKQDEPDLDPNDPLNWTVGKMMDAYIEHLKKSERTAATVRTVVKDRARYLKTWEDRLAIGIQKSDARALHEMLTRNHGPVCANHAMRYFRAAYNLANRLCDDKAAYAHNPVRAVIFNKERASGRVILIDEMKSWWTDLQDVKNPIRREMQLLDMLSGLRSENLRTIKRDDVKFAENYILIGRTKRGHRFDLPMSRQMAECCERALTASELLFPGSEWLFPTRNRQGAVTHAQVVREKAMPSMTGHILRHSHRTMAQFIGIDSINAKLLLDQKVPGMDGVYVHEQALFSVLLEDQQLISDAMFEAFAGRSPARRARQHI